MILAVSGHGAVGILDEVLLYGLIVVIIVVIVLLLRPRPRSDAADDPAMTVRTFNRHLRVHGTIDRDPMLL